jgi:hypothetical protein
MMTEWFDPAVELPKDGQECLIMPHHHGGLLTTPVFGPIAWRAQDGMWLDIFRDPEAGTLVRVDDVGCWTDWAAIAPPDGLPTPRREP